MSDSMDDTGKALEAEKRMPFELGGTEAIPRERVSVSFFVPVKFQIEVEQVRSIREAIDKGRSKVDFQRILDMPLGARGMELAVEENVDFAAVVSAADDPFNLTATSVMGPEFVRAYGVDEDLREEMSGLLRETIGKMSDPGLAARVERFLADMDERRALNKARGFSFLQVPSFQRSFANIEENSLAELIDRGDLDALREVVRQMKGRGWPRSIVGETALHRAAREGDLDACRLLVEEGAIIDARCEQGYTPLHAAAAEGKVDICTLLLEMGADPEVAGKFGRRPQDVAAIANQESCVALFRAAEAKNVLRARIEVPGLRQG